MAKKKKKKPTKKQVETLTHAEAKRKNIPTAEFQSVMADQDQKPVPVTYPRDSAAGLKDEKQARNPDLDPQLVWRGKDKQDWSDLVVQAPPLFIQEKVHPKALIDDLRRQTEAAEIAKKLAAGEATSPHEQIDLFADFNGLPDDLEAKTEFYQHDQHWSNRMILGDSLAVMASLAEREGLRGKVQCIYLDPPYGIKFNSNFQWSTTSRTVQDGKADHITREPEMVKAFRDTWRDGIHSYLAYLRDRLTVCRDLLHDTGSVFLQIGDENVHRVRALMDEVFGDGNLVAMISFRKTSSASTELLASVDDYILWYAKKKDQVKYRQPYQKKEVSGQGGGQYRSVEEPNGLRRPLTDSEKLRPSSIKGRVFRYDNMTSQRPPGDFPVPINGKNIRPNKGYWKTGEAGMSLLSKANRIALLGKTLSYVRYIDDFEVYPYTSTWDDTVTSGFGDPKIYVVQTLSKVVERCLLMASDPGDLVLDPTCGSGTTAYVAEQWGRRWITIDTSRVSLALARTRIMGARYPFYVLSDSPEGVEKLSESALVDPPADYKQRHYVGSIRQGFVYERVPHITLKSIANNTEIEVVWEKFQKRLEPLREELNKALKQKWEEWEIPRENEGDWPKEAKDAHARWWEQRILRQKEIDASIAAKADHEYLYDKPYEDKKKVRVAGPFTVESLSPHRVLGVDENDELIDPLDSVQSDATAQTSGGGGDPFVKMVLENLKTAGVQQADKSGKIDFSAVKPWPGHYIGAEAHYEEGPSAKQKRAGILMGPEFGTVSRQDLVYAAREAGDAGFDVLIACGFNYEAQASEFNKLGNLPILKARMNADLHMADDLKNTGKGNLFVIFGEPDIDLLPPEDAPQPKKGEPADLSPYTTMRVRINGVDVFQPSTGKVVSSEPDDIACWFIDTDYNGESFFVRHAYFLGASDPYKSLKTTLKAEINAEAWESLHSDVSRDFNKPEGGRIAVKVINHLGDEVMKVFRVE